MAIALSVNLNKIALLRNSRTDNNPCVEHFATAAIEHGANGLTAHPRPDQRHIRTSDIPSLANVAKKNSVEFNIEGNPFAAARIDYPGLIELVELAQPDQCTFVPDSDQQLTSDHGFDLEKDGERLLPMIDKLQSLGVRISLFMDPIEHQIKLAKSIGADRIELYTGPFALAFARSEEEGRKIFEQHTKAARLANSLGLGVNAGHDLNLNNMQIYKNLPYLDEVSIGHALTADALVMGWEQCIKAYADICS